MSEDERMERAKRIRQMREGERVGHGADEATDEADEATDDAGEATDDAVATARDGGTVPAEPEDDTPAGDDERTAEHAGDSPAEADHEPSATAADATQRTDDTGEDDPEAAVENVSGTRAPLPDAAEMASALDEAPAPAGEQDDSEAAEAVAEASTARTDAADAADVADAEADHGAEAAESSQADTGPAGVAGEVTRTEEATRVLEFTLADEQYCLDIEYIEEIVKQEAVTRVPNTPEFVEGVVDLRGQITTILNPKVTIGKDDTEPGELVVVFDGDAFEDQGYVGWIIDDVRQVSPVTDDQVNDPPMGEDYINGVIDREDDDAFVIWTTPDMAFEDVE